MSGGASLCLVRRAEIPLLFKKIGKGPGPPLHVRMEEGEIEALVTGYSFTKVAGEEAGEFNYLVKYRKIK